MKETYFLIHNSEGDTTITEINKEEFLKDIEDGSYGSDAVFLDEIPENNDTNYWGENTYLVIKGNIVTPKPVEVVTKFEIQ
jgi:hypothetical protein